ncbi:MAG: hypothetical protein RLZZ69_791 [Cyanobacteriota bacterium]
MDFYQSTTNHCEAEVNYKITNSGLCHGWVGWFAMQLGDKWLSTAPHDPPLHWSAAFLPLDPPLELQAGEEVTFKLQRPPFGDWSWKVKTNSQAQQHSTFFAMPMSLKRIKQISPQYQPRLSEKGKAAQYVLTHTDGNTSVDELSKQVINDFPQLFPNPQKALNFVRGLIISFS